MVVKSLLTNTGDTFSMGDKSALNFLCSSAFKLTKKRLKSPFPVIKSKLASSLYYNSPCDLDEEKQREIFSFCERIVTFRMALSRWDPGIPEYIEFPIPELVFIGAKGSGKSRLSERLFRHKKTVRPSVVQSETHLLNFFMLGRKEPQIMIADTPGYSLDYNTDFWERCVLDYLVQSRRYSALYNS